VLLNEKRVKPSNKEVREALQLTSEIGRYL
jgi:hypothetical protein